MLNISQSYHSTLRTLLIVAALDPIIKKFIIKITELISIAALLFNIVELIAELIMSLFEGNISKNVRSKDLQETSSLTTIKVSILYCFMHGL